MQEKEEVSNFSRSQVLQQRVEILNPLSYIENLQSFQPAGGLQYFLKNWEKLANDSFILELVKSYQIPFLSEPSETAPLSSVSMSQKETAIVDQEIPETLKKGAMNLVQNNTKSQFLSSIFIVPKKDSPCNKPKEVASPMVYV